MDQHVTDLAPTSTATTSETEPEVVAGISSAEGQPDIPTDIRADGSELGIWPMMAMFAAGALLGFAAARLLRRG
jgi:hypothetical protein